MPATASRLIVLLALTVSCVAHLAFLTPAVILGDASPFQTSPAHVISVEIVPPEEPPKPASDPPPESKSEPNPEAQSAPPPPSPPPAPAPTKPTEAAAPLPLPAPPAPPPLHEPLPAPPPAAVPSAPDATDVFALPLTLPGGMIGYEYQTPATEKPDIAEGAIAAFRRHLKTCATLPAGVSAQAKVTLRIHLNPDGTLMKGPDQNPHAVGQIRGLTTGGGDLYNAAMAAVRKCQPYAMLPADRYDEWRTIDMTFTRDNFAGE
jgi:outer membrane biosynthesis protein TonB